MEVNIQYRESARLWIPTGVGITVLWGFDGGFGTFHLEPEKVKDPTILCSRTSTHTVADINTGSFCGLPARHFVTA
jgi:hypothetical protein